MLTRIKPLGTNEVNGVYKSSIVNLFYVRTEKTIIILSKPLQIQQPANIVFNYYMQ